MIPASLHNFLSGLAAGAGINLLTSVGLGSSAPPHRIILDSLIWIAVAMALAYAGHIAESVERGVSLLVDANLSAEEQKEVYRDKANEVNLRYRVSLVVSGLLAIVAIVLIPGL